MKKLFVLFAMVAFFGNLQAQDPMKLVKKATRLLGNYNLDPVNNKDKLAEAQTKIMEAFESDEVKGELKAQQALGNVLSAVMRSQINDAILDKAKVGQLDFSLVSKAAGAFTQAKALATKKYQKREALEGLLELEPLLENAGIIALQNSKFSEAFNTFSSLLNVGDLLKEAGKKSILDTEVVLENGNKTTKGNDFLNYALNAGVQPNVDVNIEPLLKRALDSKLEEPSVYQIAFMHFSKTDKAKAADYLAKGRKMFPDDSGLLFAEINHYIEEGKLESLIDKLKTAIEKEPDNASVYSTLGNVYDQLYTKASENNETEKAEEYFNGALEYHKKATEVDPSNYASFYGIGALYFNKAANVAKEMNEASSDLSAAGMKKYDALQLKMNNLYKESFPYLSKAEELNPNDPLVLIALKEYYARVNDIKKSEEYRARIEAMNK